MKVEPCELLKLQAFEEELREAKVLAKEEGITSSTDVAHSKVVLQPGNGNKNVQESHIHLNINLSFMLRFYFGLLTLGTLRNTSKNLLNPMDTCSVEEAESGDEGGDSSFRTGEVTEAVKQMLSGRAPGVDEVH